MQVLIKEQSVILSTKEYMFPFWNTLIRDYLTSMSQRDNCKLILGSAWLELEGRTLNKVMPNNRISTSISQEVAEATMETAASKGSTSIIVGPE